MQPKTIDQFAKKYFTETLLKFGDTPKGVDAKDHESQFLRFQYIDAIIQLYYPQLTSFSLLDVGCGYGAFYSYLNKHRKGVAYYGIDLVLDMIELARRRYTEIKRHFWIGDFKSFSFDKHFDFVIASGLFNLRAHFDVSSVESHVLESIDKMYALCTKGIIFNLMVSCPEYKSDRLFYPSTERVFTHIYSNLTRKLHIITSYPLWEVTIGANR